MSNYNLARTAFVLAAIGLLLSVAALIANAGDYCQYGGKHCSTTTTTPSTTSTTSTQPENSSTTSTPSTTTTTTQDGSTSTTTTLNVSTTTVPTESTTTPNVAAWDAGATCEAVSVSFDAGIVQVDVAMLDSVPGTDELVGDLDNPFTESGSKDLRVGTPTTFRLTPVPADGFSVVPEFIDVTVPVCDDPTSSTAPAAASVPELPLTGMSNTLWATLVFVGASSAVLGWVFVMSGREDE